MSTIWLNSNRTNFWYSESKFVQCWGVANHLKCWCHPFSISFSVWNMSFPTCNSLIQLIQFINTLCLFISLWKSFESLVLELSIPCLICVCFLLYSNLIARRKTLVVYFLFRSVWSVVLSGLPACFQVWKRFSCLTASWIKEWLSIYKKNICKSIINNKNNQQYMLVTLIDTRFLSLSDAYWYQVCSSHVNFRWQLTGRKWEENWSERFLLKVYIVCYFSLIILPTVELTSFAMHEARCELCSL